MIPGGGFWSRDQFGFVTSPIDWRSLVRPHTSLRKRDSTTAIILPRAPGDRVGHLLTTGLTCPTEAPNLYTAAVGLKEVGS